MEEVINILCTPDDNYVPYCGIMLTSLFENNEEENIVVYILCEKLSDKNIADLESLAIAYNKEIRFIYLTKELFNNCPIREGDHVSIAAYYRIIAPNLLPKEIKKILYFDCDIIINNNIAELFNTDISGYAMGAVIDEAYFNKATYERLTYPTTFPSINSGVILFNLDYWRKNSTADKCLSYISHNRDKVIFHDQDTINAVLYKEIKRLPLTYNFQTGFMFTTYNYEAKVKEEIAKHVYTPTVIHYTGCGKPWHLHSHHPYVKRFLYYREISLWKNTPIIDNENFKSKLRYVITNIIWLLGIKKRPKSYIIEKQD